MRAAALAACIVLAAWQGVQAEEEGTGSVWHSRVSSVPPGRGARGSAGDGGDAGSGLAGQQQGPRHGGASAGAGGARGALRLMDLIDMYILLTQPNFFMFAGLAASLGDVDGAPIGRWVTFWAATLFFCLPALEQVGWLMGLGVGWGEALGGFECVAAGGWLG
jgi:hypothetical protein